MLRHALALLALLLLGLVSSCGTPARPPYTISIVTASGGNPFTSGLGVIRSGRVEIRVRQTDMAVLMGGATISGGAIDAVDVPIPTFGLITRIQVEVFDDNAADPDAPVLIGASPPFVPLGYAFVRIVVGPPSMCDLLSAPSLSSDRVGPNLVAVASNLVSIGGLETDGMASSHVEVLSPVQLTYPVAPLEYDGLARPIGEGGAVRLLDTTLILALSDVRRAVLYDVDPAREGLRDEDLSEAQTGNQVHAGAGSSSALVDLGADGAAIVGGVEGDQASDGITWVDLLGFATTSHLSTRRERPAAVRIGGEILVAGGQAPGEPLFERISIDAAHTSTSFGDGEPRFGAVLVRDSGSTRAWLGFGEDADGTLLDSAIRIEGCPRACVATATDPIAQPRRGVRVVERASETVILGGSDDTGPTNAVDRVRFVAGAPVVEALGVLGAARDRPGAAAIGGGVIVVGGGEGVRPELHALRDMEICFPERLDAL